MTLTMMSYGYALRLTPLKTLSFYNAVANDGKMVRPMFVKELKQYGQTLRTFPPEVMVPSIGSPKVIAQVQEALRGVVNDGTARGLKNPYYSVAGKTEPRRSRWAGTVILTVSAAVTTWPRWWGISRPTSPATVVSSRSRPTTGRPPRHLLRRIAGRAGVPCDCRPRLRPQHVVADAAVGAER